MFLSTTSSASPRAEISYTSSKAALRPKREVLADLTAKYRAQYAIAYKALAEAKRLHDDLEAVYNPHVNFDGVYALAKEHILRLQMEN